MRINKELVRRVMVRSLLAGIRLVMVLIGILFVGVLVNNDGLSGMITLMLLAWIFARLYAWSDSFAWSQRLIDTDTPPRNSHPGN